MNSAAQPSFFNENKNSISVCIFLPLLGQNVTANHRVNDAVFTEDSQQVVTGRFMYGPLDMVTLAGEKVNSFSSSHTAKPRLLLAMPA